MLRVSDTEGRRSLVSAINSSDAVRRRRLPNRIGSGSTSGKTARGKGMVGRTGVGVRGW